MTKPLVEFPSRLCEGETETGELLRRAIDEPAAFPRESACWHGLIEKRERAKRPLGRWFLLATATGGVCMLFLFLLVRRDHGSERVALNAETLAPRATAGVPALLPDALRDQHSTTTGAKVQRAVASKAESSAHGGASPAERANDTAECSQLAREGKLEQAAACYDRIAQGSSMAAELALYEKARLESRALGRGASALATLDQHARRFPKGALSTEVGMTRIELLSQLGRTDEALAAIERALGAAMGKERGGDLYALRGDLLSTSGDCPGAMAAYAAARAHGIHPSRLLVGEKRCTASDDRTDATRTIHPKDAAQQ